MPGSAAIVLRCREASKFLVLVIQGACAVFFASLPTEVMANGMPVFVWHEIARHCRMRRDSLAAEDDSCGPSARRFFLTAPVIVAIAPSVAALQSFAVENADSYVLRNWKRTHCAIQFEFDDLQLVRICGERVHIHGASVVTARH